MAGLLTLLATGVLQLAVVLHVRATLVDCASEGARLGALADRSPADGAARTRVRLTPGTDDQEVLRAALAAGPVHEFHRWRPPLTELYRDVVQAGPAEVAA